MDTTPQPDVTSPRESLELQKLALEISNLRRPWWRTPAYVLAALPLLVAAASILVVWTTGLLDAKAVNLDTKRAKLEMEVHRFEQRKDILTVANASLEAANRRLEEERNHITAQVTALVTEKSDLAARVFSLEGERVALVTRTTQLQRHLSQEQKAAAEAVERLWLAPLEQFVARVPSESSDPEAALVAAAIMDGARRQIYLDTIDKIVAAPELADEVKARLLQVAAIASGDVVRKQRLAGFLSAVITEKRATAQRINELRALSDREFRKLGVVWSPDDRETFLKVLVEHLESPFTHILVKEQLLNRASQLLRSDVPFYLHRRNPPLFLALIRTARDATMEADLARNSAFEARQAIQTGNGIRVLQRFAPPAFLVVMSELIVDPLSDRRLSYSRLRLMAPDMRQVYSVKPDTQWLRFDLGQPTTGGTQAWTEWRATNGPLVKLWTGDLRSLAKDPSFLIRAVEDGAVE